jgi:hypothetical protein
LPTVAIHDVAIHPENGEIVVATHGRSLWACDVTGLRQLKSENIGKEIAFFDPLDVTRWRNDSGRGGTNRSFVGQNPSQGAKLWYALPKKSEKVVVRIENIDGELISELNAKVEPGLHLLTWDLTQTNRDAARGPGGGTGGGTGGGGGTRPAGRAPRERSERSGDESSDRPNPNPSTPNPPAQEEADAEGQQPTPSSPADASATQNPGTQPSDTQPSRTQPSGTQNPGAASAPTGNRAPGGFLGFRGARPVPNGVYRAQLIVDGKVIKSHAISVNRDPNLPENALADELYELQVLLDKQAKENKYQNKSNGRGNYGDD